MKSVSSTVASIASANTIIASTGSQISKANENTYHQSNLLGTWTGTWKNDKKPITFKVLSIKGDTAEIEIGKNGTLKKAQATVSQNTITYGPYTMGTNDGTNGAIELQIGSVNQVGYLTKQTPPATTTDPTHLVGSWSGVSPSGQAASFNVKSVTGTSASVTYTVNGYTHTGTGTYDAKHNMITFQGTQIALSPQGNATVTYQSLGHTYIVPVKKASTAATATSTTTSTFA